MKQVLLLCNLQLKASCLRLLFRARRPTTIIRHASSLCGHSCSKGEFQSLISAITASQRFSCSAGPRDIVEINLFTECANNEMSLATERDSSVPHPPQPP